MLGLLKSLTDRKKGLKNIESNNNKKNNKSNIIYSKWEKRMLFLLFFCCLCRLCYDFFKDHKKEFEE